MQVNHVDDHVTHAVLGGHKPIDFGISQSAEFFQILSSTLYSDQIMAVARETICNAWDAHIDAGITDTPIEVTLTNDKLIIKDHGKGIPHELIGEIYGTYGNSTKKNDGKQTGGFGLGCKAPFAYTDSFEVVSCTGTMKTVYRMSKSSAEVGGKPGIIPIMTIPTQETGLTVTIAIKSNVDSNRFREALTKVIFNGDINATLNESKVKTLGFDTSKMSYILLSRSLGQNSPLGIYIRYGNVVYPVPNNEKIDEAAYRAIAVPRSINSNSNMGYGLLLQAPPHSISVTPSRESLSMQEHTINTLISLLDKFYNEVNEPFNERCFEKVKQQVEYYRDNAPYKLLNVGKGLYRKDRFSSGNWEPMITDIRQMAKVYMDTAYPIDDEFYNKDLELRFSTLLATNTVDKDLTISWFTTYKNRDPWRDQWLKKEVLTPLLDLMKQEELSEDRLYVFHKIFSEGKPPLASAWTGTEYMQDFAHQMGFVKKQIILSYSVKPDMYRVNGFPEAKKYGEDAVRNLLMYVVPRSVKLRDKALQVLKKAGFTVLDLTTAQPWERADVVAPIKPAAPKREGMLTLWNIRKDVRGSLTKIKNPAESDNVHAVCLLSTIKTGRYSQFVVLNGLTNSNDEMLKLVATMYGNRIGVAVSSVSYDTQRKKRDLPDWQDYVLASLVKAISFNKAIPVYMQGSLDDFIARHNKAEQYSVEFFKELLKMEQFKQYAVSQPKLTGYDADLYKLMMFFVGIANKSENKTRYLPLLDLYAKLSEQKEDEARVVFFKQVVRNPFIKLIDITKVRKAMLLADTDPQHIAAKAVFDEVMKGMS